MARWLVLITVGISVHTVRADWPQWRGPTGQGVAKQSKLPLEWSETQGIAWKVPIPGKGWSSPIVQENRIYLTTAVPAAERPTADQSLRTLCLDAKSGAILWNVEVFLQQGSSAPRIHAKNSHASPTPFADGDAIYVHFGHMGTARLRATDGSVVWKTQKLRYRPVHGNGGSPLVWNDKLIVMIDSPTMREVVAYDTATGEIAWRHPRSQPAKKAFSFGTPTVVNIDGTETLICTGSDVVNALDPKTGTELWAVTYEGYSMVPRPIFAQGLVFLSTGFDTPSLLAIRPVRSDSGWKASIAWRTKADAPCNSSPVVVGPNLYMVSDNGVMSCLDAVTGKLHWRERLPGAYTAALLAGADRVYAHNESGVGTVVRAGTEYEFLATNRLEGRTLASYAVDGAALLIRTDTHLYRVE